MRDLELTHAIIGAAMDVHRTLGPGLRGISYDRQKPVPLVYRDLKLDCGYRLDFVVSKRVVVEIKSIEAIAPIHESVMLTYLRLSGVSLGLLINFNVPTLKDGIRRYVWHHKEKDNAETQSDAESRREAESEIQPASKHSLPEERVHKSQNA
jgi:GxxExxY protein